MLNFFKDKEVVKFVDLTISGSNHDRMVSDLINQNNAQSLAEHYDLISRCYVASYIYHITRILNKNSMKSTLILNELEKKLGSQIFSLHDEICNHFPTQDFPFIDNSGSWIINKLNLQGTLKAMAIAHQYMIFRSVLNYNLLWNSIGANSYASAEIIGYFVNRSKDKDFALQVILFTILSEVEDIQSFEKYRNIENSNTKIVIKNLEIMLSDEKIIDMNLVSETIIRCDPIHHYARGSEYPLNLFGESLQRNCGLALDLLRSA